MVSEKVFSIFVTVYISVIKYLHAMYTISIDENRGSLLEMIPDHFLVSEAYITTYQMKPSIFSDG